MRHHLMKLAGLFVAIGILIISIDSSMATEYRMFTTQKINVNKIRTENQPEQLAPAAGIAHSHDDTHDHVTDIDSDIEENITIESVTADIATVNPDQEEPIPDDISDMMSEINVDAGMHDKSDMSYKLGPDDKIKITVFGEQDLTGEFVINGDGAITFPLLGNMVIEGLDVAKLGQMLETRLRGDYLKDPNVSVEVVQNRPFYILGEVREPGSYDFVNGMNILKAVAISGGYTYRANRKAIDVMRSGERASSPEKMKPTDPVQPGDIIYVRERFF